MTVTLGWWVIPVVLVIVGWILSSWYQRKHFRPNGGYFPDFMTPMIAGVIFGAFALLAAGFTFGLWVAS